MPLGLHATDLLLKLSLYGNNSIRIDQPQNDDEIQPENVI